jgi:16S rRNA (uracil1498-N3)-methyltransferase
MRSHPSATRFFVSGVFGRGDVVDLAGEDARKLLVVLRRTAGDAVEVVDSGGRSFGAVLEVEGSSVRARLVAEVATPRAPSLSITLAQGVPKAAKMDFVVEKATELGVARIVPFTSERTVGEGKRDGKLERWRRLARSAAQQCGRRDVPAVDAPLSFQALLERFASYDIALVPWEVAETVPLRERLPALLAGAASVLVAIGPEGGLSHGEALAAEAAGAVLVSLGSRILRTETAGLVACSALLYASGDL